MLPSVPIYSSTVVRITSAFCFRRPLGVEVRDGDGALCATVRQSIALLVIQERRTDWCDAWALASLDLSELATVHVAHYAVHHFRQVRTVVLPILLPIPCTRWFCQFYSTVPCTQGSCQFYSQSHAHGGSANSTQRSHAHNGSAHSTLLDIASCRVDDLLVAGKYVYPVGTHHPFCAYVHSW